MNSYALASIVFACVLLGALTGLALNKLLPEHHRSQASHDTIKLGTGMISVLASLVLGLLVASVKGSFDTTGSQIQTFAADLIRQDQTLRDYGPDAAKARGLLREYTTQAIKDHWPTEAGGEVLMEDPNAGTALDQARREILNLKPDDALQRGLQASAVTMMETLLQTRWLLIERSGSSIEPVFMFVLIAWITLIFLSFGYNAPANATVIVSFVVCAGALAACLFLIAEMDTPFDGVITISSQAMRDALAHMSQ
jgi:hypothetical protein